MQLTVPTGDSIRNLLARQNLSDHDKRIFAEQIARKNNIDIEDIDKPLAAGTVLTIPDTLVIGTVNKFAGNKGLRFATTEHNAAFMNRADIFSSNRGVQEASRHLWELRQYSNDQSNQGIQPSLARRSAIVDALAFLDTTAGMKLDVPQRTQLIKEICRVDGALKPEDLEPLTAAIMTDHLNSEFNEIDLEKTSAQMLQVGDYLRKVAPQKAPDALDVDETIDAFRSIDASDDAISKLGATYGMKRVYRDFQRGVWDIKNRFDTRQTQNLLDDIAAFKEKYAFFFLHDEGEVALVNNIENELSKQ